MESFSPFQNVKCWRLYISAPRTSSMSKFSHEWKKISVMFDYRKLTLYPHMCVFCVQVQNDSQNELNDMVFQISKAQKKLKEISYIKENWMLSKFFLFFLSEEAITNIHIHICCGRSQLLKLPIFLKSFDCRRGIL